MNFHDSIRRAAKHNTDYRRVLAAGKHSQLVLMSIPPEGEIGTETHPDTDQVFFVVKGEGQAIVGGEARKIEKNDVVFVPAGTEHNLKNIEDDEDLKLVTVYAPPAHAVGTVHRTRTDALAAEASPREPAMA